MTDASLVVRASPHLQGPDSTPRIMASVLLSLLPSVAAAAWFFGPSALIVVAASSAGALATERGLGRGGTLGDGSAAITGLLLGLSLPAGIPLWMAFVGGAFGIGFGKLVFGGLGQNVFNPALVGRAFLQAAFPSAMTTWPAVGAGSWWSLRGDNLALPFARPAAPDALSGATPLGRMKFEHADTELWDLVIGSTSGSLGETCALAILAGGLWLAWRGSLNWRIPVAVFASVAACSGGLHAADAARYPGALFMLFSGGLVLGATYMATDLVTSPVTHRGCWIFGAGIGVLVVVIRIWGGLAEGVQYAILIMNALVPFLNRATQPRPLGARGRRA
jgi:electron transport complex protein RnfD